MAELVITPKMAKNLFNKAIQNAEKKEIKDEFFFTEKMDVIQNIIWSLSLLLDENFDSQKIIIEKNQMKLVNLSEEQLQKIKSLVSSKVLFNSEPDLPSINPKESVDSDQDEITTFSYKNSSIFFLYDLLKGQLPKRMQQVTELTEIIDTICLYYNIEYKILEINGKSSSIEVKTSKGLELAKIIQQVRTFNNLPVKDQPHLSLQKYSLNDVDERIEELPDVVKHYLKKLPEETRLQQFFYLLDINNPKIGIRTLDSAYIKDLSYKNESYDFIINQLTLVTTKERNSFWHPRIEHDFIILQNSIDNLKENGEESQIKRLITEFISELIRKSIVNKKLNFTRELIESQIVKLNNLLGLGIKPILEFPEISRQTFFEIVTSEPQKIEKIFNNGFHNHPELINTALTKFYSENMLFAMKTAINNIESRWYPTNKDEKLTRLKKIESNYKNLLTSGAEPSKIQECIKEFIRELSLARDGSPSAKTESSKAFFNSLNADTKDYVFEILGASQEVNNKWEDFVSLVEAGRALPMGISELNFYEQNINEWFNKLITFYNCPGSEKKQLIQFSSEEKLEMICLILKVRTMGINSKDNFFQIQLKTTEAEKFKKLPLSNQIDQQFRMLDIYQAMLKTTTRLKSNSCAGEKKSKFEKLNAYRKQFLKFMYNGASDEEVRQCIESFIQEAARARKTFWGASSDARNSSCKSFFKNLNINSVELIFDILGAGQKRKKDFDSFIEVLNAYQEKTASKKIYPELKSSKSIKDYLLLSMENAIGNGWISGEKTSTLQAIKQEFSQSENDDEAINKLLEFIKVAAEPRGCKPFAADFGKTKSCSKFFDALDEHSKKYVFEALGFRDARTDKQSFVDAVQKFDFESVKSSRFGKN